MKPGICGSERNVVIDIERTAAVIARNQRETGEIPWGAGEKTDPWDHVEAAMGLSIGGRFDAAQRAFEWSAGSQQSDGSWYSAYRNGTPVDRTRETHMAAYIAVGVYHYYLSTEELGFLRNLWPTVAAAVNFAISLQSPSGEVFWAVSPEGEVDPMALLTGCSSIYMSLRCALAIADELGHSQPGWKAAYTRLGHAIRHRPYAFNMTKSRFSMDWFYPVLCGAVTGADAHGRIQRQWKKFVVKGLGVRCVSDQPWVTIAETSELVLTLTAMGEREKAQIVFNWLTDHVFTDGSFWCGFTFPDMTRWPEEKIAWTNAVVLMAADALFDLTPAARLFSQDWWNGR